MKTLLIRGVSEDLLKELRRLKVELDCKTWAELLEKLVTLKRIEIALIDEKHHARVKEEVEKLIKLREVVSEKWKKPHVLEEFRKARHHVS